MKELDIVIVVEGELDGKPATFTNITTLEEERMIVVYGEQGFCFNWDDARCLSGDIFRSDVQGYLDAKTPTQRGLATGEIKFDIEEVLICKKIKFSKLKLNMKTLSATTNLVYD